MPGPPPPRNLLWSVTDARDVAQAFRLAVKNKELAHNVFGITGYDTCSLVPSQELVTRYFPQVPVGSALEGCATLASYNKATRLLGYRPRYSWRTSDFQDWLESTIGPRRKMPIHSQ
jgi:nucleoside-diphosphate-sugar epimerase